MKNKKNTIKIIPLGGLDAVGKNMTLFEYDGAIIIEDNIITATRVVLPIDNNLEIPARFGLRHRAASSGAPCSTP